MSDPVVHDPPSTDLVAAVEAVLFAAAEPVQPKEIAAAFSGTDEEGVLAAIEALSRRLSQGTGGLVVEQVAGAYRLATRPEVGAVVRLFFRQRNRTRLTPAGLETLAIVSYRQPITAPEIQAIRGVDPAGPRDLARPPQAPRRRSRIVGRPSGSLRVVTTPRGLWRASQVAWAGGGGILFPSTRIASCSGSTFVPSATTTSPFTLTRPARISRSAARREAIPAWASAFWRRSLTTRRRRPRSRRRRPPRSRSPRPRPDRPRSARPPRDR